MADEDQIDEPSGIKTLDKETYAPPTSRVGSVAGVKSRISELRYGDSRRSAHRTEMDGLIDGNAPYIQVEMDDAGRGDDANFNDRSAEGMVDAATTPYYGLEFGVPKAVTTEISYTDPDGNITKQKADEWANKFDERYTKTLWAWSGYRINLQISHSQTVIYGRGPLIWHGRYGWHFEAKRDDQVWVADNAMCDIGRLSEVAIPGHFDPVELFKKVDNKIKPDNEGRKNGWDFDAAMEAIINAAPDTLRANFGDAFVQYQTSLRRGDVDWSNKEARISYTSYLVKEFNGKITHVIVLNDAANNPYAGTSPEKFLYKKVGKFDSFHQVLNPMFFNVPRDGNWYSVKGLGPKIFDMCDAFNRLNCTLLNGAMAGCGIVMQAANAQALQKVQQTPIVRASGMTFVPPDWSFAQSNIAPRLDGPLAIKRDFQGTLQSNTGQYRQRVSEENQEPTLGQAQMNAQHQATLSLGAYDRYYDQADDRHKETIRRMLDPGLTEDDPGGKEAKEMIRCLIEEDQIPQEVLKFENFTSVKAFRSVGMGSLQMQQMTGQQLIGLMGTMNPEGRQNALRFNGAGLVGQSNVDKFWQPFEELGVPTDQEAWAIVENNILRQPGAQLAVTPGQNPSVHFITHYKDALQHIQQLKAGQANPTEVVTHLDNTGPHNQQHLKVMEGDPTRKDELAQFVKMQMALAKMADQLKQQVSQAQQEQQNQQAQPQLEDEHAKDLLKIVLDDKTKNQKLMLDEARKQKKFEFDTHLKDLKTADGIQRQNIEMANAV